MATLERRPAAGASRRDFLRLAGATGLVGLGMAACGGTAAPRTSPSPSRAGQLTFRSRPDLVVPEVKVVRRTAGDLSGHVFCNVHSPNMAGGPLILDGQGHPVWFLSLKDKFAANVSTQQYQGSTVLTWWEGDIISVGYGQGICVIADDAYRRIATVQAQKGLQADLHDFQLTPQGTALITVYKTIHADLSSVGGPSHGKMLDGIVQEIDVSTGELLFEWQSSKHVDIAETRSAYTHGSKFPFDYFHINSIDVDSDGNLLISARNTWGIYKVDRTTGAVLWRLGGRRSDFAMGHGTQFEWQHDARRQADGTISLFDDGAAPKEERRSRAMFLKVDEAARTVSLARELTNGNVLATSQGNTQVLPDGNVFVGWGSAPRFTEFSRDGQIVFDATFQTANQSYRTFRLPWTGHPVDQPVAVARRGPGRRLTVHASWNGATEYTGWRVLAGPDAHHLAMVGGAARTGFETAIQVATSHRYIAAQALDAAGTVLGLSRVISTS